MPKSFLIKPCVSSKLEIDGGHGKKKIGTFKYVLPLQFKYLCSKRALKTYSSG